jgi:hypothetical protein
MGIVTVALARPPWGNTSGACGFAAMHLQGTSI